MFIERRFFKWNENDNNMPVRLGDNVYSLLENGIIVKDQKGNQDYRLEGNNDIWIGSKDDLVHFIYFCNHSGDELLCLDPFDFKYPATRPITELLSKKYKQLHFASIDEVNKSYSGDLLYLIFRDYVPTNLFLMRI